jgi:hypothetical protein
MKTLCNHFSRKTTARYEGDRGHIEFQDGKCEFTAASKTLMLQVEAENANSLSRVKQVDHLLRFMPAEC